MNETLIVRIILILVLLTTPGLVRAGEFMPVDLTALASAESGRQVVTVGASGRIVNQLHPKQLQGGIHE